MATPPLKNNNDIIDDESSIDDDQEEITTQLDLPSSSTMDDNNITIMQEEIMQTERGNNKRYIPLLVINYVCLFIGSVTSSLLSKYYFNHKGSSRWVSTWVQSSGFPLLLIPITLPYFLNLTKRKPFTDFTTKMVALSISIGFMLGINNLLFSWGNSFLPVSTSSLLLSSQLVFNLVLSIIIVKQKLTFSNVNCVVLLTLSSILLGLDSSHEKNETKMEKDKYFIGFFCTIGAGLLFALYLPVMELVYRRVYCYQMVMEMQLIMEVAATLLASIGMSIDGGFSHMKVESERVFEKGGRIYWLTVTANMVTWQMCFMGTAGMIYMTSSLTGGICTTALVSMNVVGGVLVFRDSFNAVKAVSTAICIWGFCSYLYGLYTKNSHHHNHSSSSIEKDKENEMIPIINPSLTR
ncbi:probable purine permease 4 [Arachis stenosperma]|uniref:probable purine permease 4 n=1 Tax=Arachis stenosperma TaxID=217475 RepID=UPI0025AC9F01|nr:probable purine permease 4 [Arachis stenosperma]